MIIIQDDREKTPFDFAHFNNVTVEVERMETGDYTTPDLHGVAAVERKSLEDLAGSLGSDRSRFEAEVDRAASLMDFQVVIEAPRHLVQTYADSGAKSCPHYYCGTYPKSITGTIDSWPQYKNVEFNWYPDKTYAAFATYDFLRSWEREYC